MKIESLKLSKFKGYSDAEFILGKKSTIFFGINGVGKSSVLRAINLIYANIINKIVQSRFKQKINLELEDIKYGSSFCKIKCDLALNNDVYNYSRTLFRKGKNRRHAKNVQDEIAESFNDLYIDPIDCNMPIYVNYGVNRSVFDIPLRIRNRHTFDKISAFEGAIESKIDFRVFFEWFRNQEDYENEVIARENREYKDKQLSCVKNAILTMLDDFSNLRVERNPLRMVISKNKLNLRIEQLSDGEKCTLSMIGDLARRLALANSYLNNPLEGEGVVLIDEIELHMHPTWQRRIVNTLTHTFPNIQFIITTHSPQVLGEIGENINIYKLYPSDNGKFNYEQIKSLDDWDSNYILEEFMETSCLNLEAKGRINQMYNLIAEKKFNEAKTYLDRLEKSTNSAHEDVIRAKILIDRGSKTK